MKLTDRGREFLKAILAGSIVATLVGINIVLVLCLSLVFVALVSRMVLARYLSAGIEIKPDNPNVSCFKEELVNVHLSVRPSGSRFVNISLSRLTVSEGVETKIEEGESNMLNLFMKPTFAGRFSGFSAVFELQDPLHLFKKTVKLQVDDFRLDSYPLSLLKEIRTAMPVSISLGDREGNSPGAGMEFYSIDEYNGSSEWKNILWKKVASMPDERLLVKKRAVNLPKSITIALIHTENRGEDSLKWMDSACEGVAGIGKIILKIGCDVEITYDAGGTVVSEIATDIGELAKVIMKMSTSTGSDLYKTSLLLPKADICITGFKELRNGQLASAIARKPTLLIEDSGVPLPELSDLAIIYEPNQDLTHIIRRVAGI